MTARLRGRAAQRLRAAVVEAYGTTCYLCRQPIDDLADLTVDHVVALAAGGTNDLANLRPAHGRRRPGCPGNYGKGARPFTPPTLTPSRSW